MFTWPLVAIGGYFIQQVSNTVGFYALLGFASFHLVHYAPLTPLHSSIGLFDLENLCFTLYEPYTQQTYIVLNIEVPPLAASTAIFVTMQPIVENFNLHQILITMLRTSFK